jgi:predicted RNase H-like HicB family nuclease
MYPAVFTREDVGYSVHFPDLEGCFTQGDTLQEAVDMSKEALGLYLQQQDTSFIYPPATEPTELTVGLTENEFIMLIEFDELEYIKQYDNKAVKKTLTIPSWLNKRAEKAGAPFSQILQKGLKEYLHLSS